MLTAVFHRQCPLVKTVNLKVLAAQNLALSGTAVLCVGHKLANGQLCFSLWIFLEISLCYLVAGHAEIVGRLQCLANVVLKFF